MYYQIKQVMPAATNRYVVVKSRVIGQKSGNVTDYLDVYRVAYFAVVDKLDGNGEFCVSKVLAIPEDEECGHLSISHDIFAFERIVFTAGSVDEAISRIKTEYTSRCYVCKTEWEEPEKAELPAVWSLDHKDVCRRGN